MISDMVQRYSSLVGRDDTDETPVPVTYFPKLTLTDYKRGFIRRSFVIRYDGLVTEVSQKWLSDNDSLPAIFEAKTLKWFVVDASILPIERGMKSTDAKHRNEHYIKAANNRYLNLYLLDLEQFKA